jgi:hypothetical protein
MACLDPTHDGNKAHELTQLLHDTRLNALKGGAAQFAKNASTRESDHNFIAANFDEFAIAAIPPQIWTDLLDHVFDELKALCLSSHRVACLSRFSQHGIALVP